MIPPRSCEPWLGVVRIGLDYWEVFSMFVDYCIPGTRVGTRVGARHAATLRRTLFGIGVEARRGASDGSTSIEDSSGSAIQPRPRKY